MHQISFVENIAVELLVLGILDQNLRSLAQAGEQLVRRLGRKNHRLLAARAIRADGVIIAIKIMEGGVRQPGFVEMQGVDLAVQLFLDVLDVVEDAVVS